MSKARSFTPRAQELEAILARRQTQFRRPVEPQPENLCGEYDGLHGQDAHGEWWFCKDGSPIGPYKCLFGLPGDALWLQEKWLIDCPYGPPEGCGNPDHIYHFSGEPAAGSFPMPWRAAITMPAWASRLTLRVLNVRVERVRDIQYKDCLAEGVMPSGDFSLPDYVDAEASGVVRRVYRDSRGRRCIVFGAKAQFADTWDATYAAQGLGFEDNPWAWVADFEVG